MSLWDVFAGKQSFGSWLTGRDPKESDVYANPDLVDKVVSEIKNIATTGVSSARDAVYEALNKLNYAAQSCGTIEVSKFDSVFDSISDTIKQLATQMEGKVSDIKKYEESSIFEKVGSTVFMTVCKVGEGLLSVVEDIGDGIVSLVGWGAGALGAKDFQQKCGDFVKKDLSHKAFEWYYDSDFAKASAITEDSAIASGCKLAGKVVGYVYGGGVVGGALKAVGVAGTALASTSTLGATAVGLIGGIGSGTESGLQAGMEFNDAFKVGLKTGAVQGALAFAGGKFNEHAQAVKGGASGLKAWRGDAVGADGNLVQGYTDAITKAGERFGESTVNTVKSGVGVVKARVAGDAAAAATATQSFKANAKELLTQNNPVSQGAQAIKSAPGAIKNGVAKATQSVKNGVSKVKNAVKPSNVASSAKGAVSSAGKTVSNAVLHPVQAAKGIVTGTAKVVGKAASATAKVVGKVAVPAGVAINETINSEGKAYGQLATKYAGYEKTINDTSTAMVETVQGVVGDAPVASEGTFQPTSGDTNDGGGYDTSTPTSYPDGGSTGGGYTYTDGGSTSGGSTGGGYTGGGYTGGGSTGGYTGGSTAEPYIPAAMSTTPISGGTTVTPGTIPIVTTPTQSTPTSTSTISNPVPSVEIPPVTPASTQNTPRQSTPAYTAGSSYVPQASTTTTHTGGSYGAAGVGSYDSPSQDASNAPAVASSISSSVKKDASSLVDDIISGNKYSRIPTSVKPTAISKTKNKASMIPLAAGAAAASVAGLGAKAAMDFRNENQTDEYDEEDNDLEYDDWENEDSSADETQVQNNQGEDEYYSASDVVSGNFNQLQEA